MIKGKTKSGITTGRDLGVLCELEVLFLQDTWERQVSLGGVEMVHQQALHMPFCSVKVCVSSLYLYMLQHLLV